MWELFKENFLEIIKSNDYYYENYLFISKCYNNILLYGAYGFPTDLFIDEIIKKKFNIENIYKEECLWDKKFIYIHNQFFIEIDLMNPSIPKDFSFLTKFISQIITNKNINSNKHFIIIKHIDILNFEYQIIFRILLEKYHNNAYFLCTTHRLSKIDSPIKSRFFLIRVPLLSNNEIINIFNNILKKPLNKMLIKNNNNIIKTIFISEVEEQQPLLVTEDFCKLNFPPISDFIKNFKKNKKGLEDIRNFSYKCFQYNISIKELIIDILKINFIKLDKNKFEIIKYATDLDHTLNITNKSREPIYIESLLCFILL